MVLVLVFGWCEHVQGAVAPSRVMPDFDVVVDCAREFDPGLPALAVEQLDLHAPPEGLDYRIVVGSADGSHRRRKTSVSDLLAEGP